MLCHHCLSDLECLGSVDMCVPDPFHSIWHVRFSWNASTVAKGRDSSRRSFGRLSVWYYRPESQRKDQLGGTLGSSKAWSRGCSPSIARTGPQHWKIVAGEWLQWRWYTVIQWISEIAHGIGHGDRPRDSSRSFQASWCWRRPATFAQVIPCWTWFPSRCFVAELLDCHVDNSRQV